MARVFLWLFLTLTILACFAAADLLSAWERWEVADPLLLFLGLLTLLNGPFRLGFAGPDAGIIA